MKNFAAYVSASLVGIVFGVVANSSILLGQWSNLIIWAVVGILVGLFIEQPKFVTWSGILYGVFLTFAFLVSGFRGQVSQLPGFIALTFVFCIVGGFCGWILVALANNVKMRFRK